MHLWQQYFQPQIINVRGALLSLYMPHKKTFPLIRVCWKYLLFQNMQFFCVKFKNKFFLFFSQLFWIVFYMLLIFLLFIIHIQGRLQDFSQGGRDILGTKIQDIWTNKSRNRNKNITGKKKFKAPAWSFNCYNPNICICALTL